MADNRLTDYQWAIICTIHQEPNYKFNGGIEKMAARRMADLGLLRLVDIRNMRYEVTEKGELLYLKSS